MACPTSSVRTRVIASYLGDSVTSDSVTSDSGADDSGAEDSEIMTITLIDEQAE